MAKKKKHILIIDDEPAWQKITSIILKKRGYSVCAVGNGSDALKALSSFKPDLILSDLRMPDMNGFDLLYNLKQIPSASSTPVVFFTAIDDYEARKEAKKLGAVDFLVKPYDEEEISLILSKYLP